MTWLHLTPLELRDANGLVERLHRHRGPKAGHRFALGAVDDAGMLRGAVIVARPASRAYPPDRVAEVSRLVSDGTRNVCSFLLAAAARTAKAMGFQRIITYTLPEEGGASLRAAGWVLEHQTLARGGWVRSDGAPRADAPSQVKCRWALTFTPPSAQVPS